MRMRISIIVAGALLCSGAIAIAQDKGWTFLQADRIVVGAELGPVPIVKETTLTGKVVFEVNGVLVRADRAVIRDREVSLEGNVSLTLPQPK